MGSIKNFKLLIEKTPDSPLKALPEYNHKKMFDSISFEHTDKMYRVQCCSKDIVALDDWHDYYPELARRTNIKKVRDLVLHALSNSKYWQDYVRQIDDWLECKRVDLGLIARLANSDSAALIDKSD